MAKILSMENYVRISELKDHVGQSVQLKGWLYQCRSSGKLLFIVLRDGTGLCQCIVEKTAVSAELFDQLEHLGQESSLDNYRNCPSRAAERRRVSNWP